MSRFQFGTGVCFLTPNAGDLVANPTPRQLATMQDCSIEFAGSLKELKGMSLFPDDIALASMKITGKAKLGQLDIALFNDNMFSETMNTGSTATAFNESHAIPGTPYTVTVTPPGSGTYSADRGVKYAATGEQLMKVASGPVTGQYSESAGAYLFAAADTTLGVLISYDYTLTTGTNFIVNNQLQGHGPSFELLLRGFYETKFSLLRLPACKAEKISVPSKQGDFWIAEMDFQAYANPGGQVAQFYQS